MSEENIVVKRNGLTWVMRWVKVRGEYVPKWSVSE